MRARCSEPPVCLADEGDRAWTPTQGKDTAPSSVFVGQQVERSLREACKDGPCTIFLLDLSVV